MKRWNIFRRIRGRTGETKVSFGEEKALDEILMTHDKERITRSVLEMGRTTYEMLDRSLSVSESDEDEDAQSVIDQDNDVDRLEMEIDWECLSTMAMRQPIHDDLRYLFAVIKMTTDLERVADESTNVARHLLLHRAIIRDTDDLAEIRFIRDCILQQLTDALEAFEKQDLSLAQKIFSKDKAIDACYDKLYETFLDKIPANTNDEIRRQAYILALARHLERAGDHIVNIAEYICFMITGERIPSESDPNKDSTPLD